MNEAEPETIGLSYLNAFEYCPRRFYYEFVQGEMLINEFVLEGTLLHERADQPGQHTNETGELEINHLYLVSQELRLTGFADVVEQQPEQADSKPQLIPIEYKHGKQGKWLNDHVQLCAQALCLEELQPDKGLITHGYLFYFGSRKRLRVDFTSELRAYTLATIDEAFRVATLPTPPPPLEGKKAARCRDCSLESLCLPKEVKLLQASHNTERGDYFAHAISD